MIFTLDGRRKTLFYYDKHALSCEWIKSLILRI
jgi:hypothetical protein